jgi:hypothetical protein
LNLETEAAGDLQNNKLMAHFSGVSSFSIILSETHTNWRVDAIKILQLN